MSSAKAGFLSNAAAVAAVATSYDVAKIVTLLGVEDYDTSTTIVDATARPLPPTAWWDHVEIHVSAIAGGATSLTWALYYDAAGDYRATDDVTDTLNVGNTTATKGSVVAAIGAYKKQPKAGSYQTALGKLYLIAKVNAGTVTIDHVKMHWTRILGDV